MYIYAYIYIYIFIYIYNEEKQFLLCKKLFGRINHHQLLNEYVLYNFFAFYQTLLSRAIKNNTTN